MIPRPPLSLARNRVARVIVLVFPDHRNLKMSLLIDCKEVIGIGWTEPRYTRPERPSVFSISTFSWSESSRCCHMLRHFSSLWTRSRQLARIAESEPKVIPNSFNLSLIYCISTGPVVWPPWS